MLASQRIRPEPSWETYLLAANTESGNAFQAEPNHARVYLDYKKHRRAVSASPVKSNEASQFQAQFAVDPLQQYPVYNLHLATNERLVPQFQLYSLHL